MVWLLSIFALASVALVRATAVKDKPQDIIPLSPYYSNCQRSDNSFVVIKDGGDGIDTPYWYVGRSDNLEKIIVAHRGTDSNKLFADLTGADVLLEPLDPSLFPGIPSDVKAHHGFAREQARTAEAISSSLIPILMDYPRYNVTIVGHSLGGALALLDGVSLLLRSIVSSSNLMVITYGMPRIGNQAFANFVDRQLIFEPNLMHVNNREDPIPVMPDMSLGYHHPSGEVHIQDSGAVDACPGQDNPSELCIVGDVKNIFEGNMSDHNGPYAGVTIGC